MKRTILGVLVILAAGTSFAGKNQYVFNFSSGIPAGLTVESTAGAEINPSYYNAKIGLSAGWQTERVTDDNQKDPCAALVSPSRLQDNVSPQSWIYLPEITVESGDCLQWTARSIEYNNPDSYTVLISVNSPKSNSYTVLEEVVDERYTWTYHSISLDRYAGRNISLAILHESPGYMLAIKSISLGSPTIGMVSYGAEQHFFYPGSEPVVKFTATNFNPASEPIYFQVKSLTFNGTERVVGDVIGEVESPEPVNNVYSVCIPLDLKQGEATAYAVYSVTKKSSTLLFDDYANYGDFPRKLLIEKFTATWCNACTAVVHPVRMFEAALPGEHVYLEPHGTNAAGYDLDAIYDYIKTFPTSMTANYPSVYINREFAHDEVKPFDRTALRNAMLSPCTTGVELEITKFDGTELSAKAIFTSSVDIDNTADNIRMGFVLTENDVHLSETGGKPQQNLYTNSSLRQHSEFNFLPNLIPQDMTVNNGIVRGPVEGGAGIELTLPAQIKAGETYEVPFSMTVPEKVLHPESLTLAALACDRSTKRFNVLNADAKDLTTTSGIEGIAVANSEAIVSVSGSDISVAIAEAECLEVEVYSLTGTRIAVENAKGCKATISAPEASGIYLLKITHNGRSEIRKIIL